MVTPAIPGGSLPSAHTQQFLSSVLSQRGPSSVPYTEDVKWLIRQHLLSLSEAVPSLQPKTATFTHNDGGTANLLQADGTVPMIYHEVTYNIPVVIWLMESYPRHPPLVFVNPTRDMIIKPQHPYVNPSGMVSIPYLQNWVYPSSNLVDLTRNLSHYFGLDSPLYSRRPPISASHLNPNPSFSSVNSMSSSNSMAARNFRFSPAVMKRADSPPSFEILVEREMMKRLTSQAEAERLLGMAEWLLHIGNLNGCRCFAVRAQEIEPLFDGSDQILAIVDVLFAFETRTNNQPDWYSVLQLDRRFDDIEIIKRQYRRLFLLLHPDKNKYPAADIAFKLVADAWNVLSDPTRKAQYDGDSPPSIEIEREKKKRFMVSPGGEVYAVFESTDFLPFQYQYFIYKLDFVKDMEEGSPIVGVADPDIRHLGQPIATLSTPYLPLAMCIFSFGSKIYFCGGVLSCPCQFEIQLPGAQNSHHICNFQHSCYAYMFDVDLKQGTPIPSMQHPKPDPMVFGPVDGDKFYVFGNPDIEERSSSSMEILNTSTHTWESIHIPTSLSWLVFSHASVLCGSNILFSLSDKPGLYSFSTIYKTWQQLSPFSFPFKQSLYLSHVPDIGGHILLSAPYRDYLPVDLYLLPNNPCDAYDDHLLTPLGNVEGLTFEELYYFLGGEIEGGGDSVYIWNTPLSICVVRDKDVGHSRYHADPESDRHYHLAIDIFNLNDPVLDGSTKMIKVKVENTSQYKYVCGNEMRQRHFFVVG